MKLRSIALAGVAVLALSVPAAASDTTGWYLGLGVGWDSMADFNQHVVGAYTPPIADYNTKTEDAALFIGTFGYRFENGFRLENEVGYVDHNINGGDLPSANITTSFTGSVTVLSDFVNLLYDYPLTSRLDLFGGGGIGAANVHSKIAYTGVTYFDVDQIRFAALGIIGLKYWLSDTVDIGVDYRYRAFLGDMSYTQVINERNCIKTIGDLNENVVMFSLRYYFESPPPPPPPPPPPQPPSPPPPPPPPVTTYIVFFDFNKSNLTEAAQAVVAEAVKTAKASGFVRVQIVGHTDTVGSDKYNMRLSMARAESVKDEMVREGMDGTTIAVDGKGFHDPLVATGPGVREPQNRRAVIDLGK